jgi:hypothetical protein
MRKPAPLSRAARQAAAGAITGRAPAWTPSTAQNDHVSKAGLSVPRLARPVPLDVVRTADGRLGLFCREQPYQGPAPSFVRRIEDELDQVPDPPPANETGI